jgi:hypothetical protein
MGTIKPSSGYATTEFTCTYPSTTSPPYLSIQQSGIWYNIGKGTAPTNSTTIKFTPSTITGTTNKGAVKPPPPGQYNLMSNNETILGKITILATPITVTPVTGYDTTEFTVSYPSTPSPPYLSIQQPGVWYNIGKGTAPTNSTMIKFKPATITGSTNKGAIKPPPPGQYSLMNNNISEITKITILATPTTISPSSGYDTTEFTISYPSTPSPPYLSIQQPGVWYNIGKGTAPTNSTMIKFKPSTITGSTNKGAIKPPPPGEYNLMSNNETILGKITILATSITITPTSGSVTTEFTCTYPSTTSPPYLSIQQPGIWYNIGKGTSPTNSTMIKFKPSTITGSTNTGAVKPPPAGEYSLMSNNISKIGKITIVATPTTLSPSSGYATTAFTVSYSSTSNPPVLSIRPVGQSSIYYTIGNGNTTGYTFTPSALTVTSLGATKPPPPGQYNLIGNGTDVLATFAIVSNETTISPISGYSTTAFTVSYSSTASPPYLSMRPVGKESTVYYNIAYGGPTGYTFTPSALTNTSSGATKPPPAGQYSLYDNISNTILSTFTIVATSTTISPSSGYATTAFTVSYSSTATPPVLSMSPVGQSSVYYTIGTGNTTGYTFTPSALTNTSSGATKPPPAGQYNLLGNGTVLLTFTITSTPITPTTISPSSGYATTAFTVSYSSTSNPPVLSMSPVGQSSIYYTIGTGGATGYTFTPSTLTVTSSGATKPPPAGQYNLMGNTDVLLTFTILENSNKWTNVFPVGGVAISGGEANSNLINSMNGAYDMYTSSLWNSKSNLVRLPVVWGLYSKGNNENMLFTSSTYPGSGSWAYNQNYLDAIVTNVTKIVNANKVVIIDMHTYMKWNSDVNLNKDQLAVIWSKVLLLFNTYPIFKNLLVWFELVNEPYSINDLADYQATITNIRNAGYSNKLVLGINAYNKWGHVINNGYILPNGSYEKGISSYTGGFPTDSKNNMCVTLHQYFNSVGSGTNYNSEPMLNPWWTTPNGNLTTEMLAISNLNNGKCDFLLGEFGYDSNYNTSNCGKNAVVLLLNAMNSSNTSNNLTSTTVPDFLSKTTGKLWLGFAAWQLNAYPTSYTENYASDSIYSSTYSTFFE